MLARARNIAQRARSVTCSLPFPPIPFRLSFHPTIVSVARFQKVTLVVPPEWLIVTHPASKKAAKQIQGEIITPTAGTKVLVSPMHFLSPRTFAPPPPAPWTPVNTQGLVKPFPN